MKEPQTVPENALRGMTVALSVSDSADLHRLGLTNDHYDMAVAELARAVFLAGGSIIYGGRIQPEGFTQVLLEEVQRYSDRREALVIYVPASEHKDVPTAELEAIDNRLGRSARLVLLGPDGQQFDPKQLESIPSIEVEFTARAALTSMRQVVTELSDARVVVGGKLLDFQGRMPGILEEALLTVTSGKPLYVAGGFGGASAAIAHSLGHDDLCWAPSDFPLGAQDALVAQALADLTRAAAQSKVVDTGLDDAQRSQLASTHRTGEMATLVALGLARMWSRSITTTWTEGETSTMG
jgi:hypothetical protein